MQRAASLEAFVRDPIGSWIVSGPSLAWCSSPERGGSTVWGSPDREATRAILRPFEGVWAPKMSERVDIFFDARRVERVDPLALGVVVEWTVARRKEIERRVRRQVSVVPPGAVGFLLSGILPVIGETHPFRVVHDHVEGYRAFFPEGGDALGAEVEGLVEAAIGIPVELRKTREHLRDHVVDATLASTARAIGTSPRSLQRVLAGAATTFQTELQNARFTRACELLRSTDEKIAAIAGEVGLTEGGLSRLFRDRLGCSAARYRAGEGG